MHLRPEQHVHEGPSAGGSERVRFSGQTKHMKQIRIWGQVPWVLSRSVHGHVGRATGQGCVCAPDLRFLPFLWEPSALGRSTGCLGLSRGPRSPPVTPGFGSSPAPHCSSALGEAVCGADPSSWFLGVSIMSLDPPWHKSCLLCGCNQVTKTRCLLWSFISEPEKPFFNRTRKRLPGSVAALGEPFDAAQSAQKDRPTPVSVLQGDRQSHREITACRSRCARMPDFGVGLRPSIGISTSVESQAQRSDFTGLSRCSLKSTPLR